MIYRAFEQRMKSDYNILHKFTLNNLIPCERWRGSCKTLSSCKVKFVIRLLNQRQQSCGFIQNVKFDLSLNKLASLKHFEGFRELRYFVLHFFTSVF